MLAVMILVVLQPPSKAFDTPVAFFINGIS